MPLPCQRPAALMAAVVTLFAALCVAPEAKAQSSPLVGQPRGAAATAVNASGQVSVGTTAPATGGKDDNKAGTAEAAETGNEACTTANVGQTRYNAALGYLQVCE